MRARQKELEGDRANVASRNEQEQERPSRMSHHWSIYPHTHWLTCRAPRSHHYETTHMHLEQSRPVHLVQYHLYKSELVRRKTGVKYRKQLATRRYVMNVRHGWSRAECVKD